MKKTLTAACVLALVAGPAMAAANVENPLYNPKAGDFYTKTGIGAMYKKSDSTRALVAKGADGLEDFPVLRITEHLGVGITDRLSARGEFGFTKSDETNRKGLHNGRMGLNYRILDGEQSPLVWDVYADAHLGGVMKMEADVIPVSGGTSLGFDYGNYTNGRYGIYLGTRVGKTWDKFTGSAFAEVQQTFGNENNNIGLTPGARQLVQGMVAMKMGAPIAAMYAAGLPGDFTVKLKSTLEVNAGFNAFYQINSDWSVGGGFTYKHRQDNVIQRVNLDVDTAATGGLPQAAVDQITKAVIDASGFLGSLHDGWNEYTISAAVANQLTETIQVALYGEYTFDTSHYNSQNGTDVKAEVGVRVNLQF